MIPNAVTVAVETENVARSADANHTMYKFLTITPGFQNVTISFFLIFYTCSTINLLLNRWFFRKFKFRLK